MVCHSLLFESRQHCFETRISQPYVDDLLYAIQFYRLVSYFGLKY